MPNFKDNTYNNLFKTNTELTTNESLTNYVKLKQKYCYENVKFTQFSKKYSQKGWIGRKFIAIPRSIWSGLIKTIFQLALGIIWGIFRSPFDKGKSSKKLFFRIARNYQESFGWITTLFHDRYGQYLVQKSHFHQKCYDCFSINKSNDESIEELVLYFLSKNNINSAKRIYDKHSLSCSNNKFQELTATHYLNKGMFEKAYKEINDCYPKTKEGTKIIVKIAKGLISNDNLEKATKTIKLLNNFSCERVETLNTIANSYFNKGDLDNSYSIAKECNYQTLILKIAKSYAKNNDLINAFKIFNKINFSLSPNKGQFCTRLLKKYLKTGSAKNALNSISIISNETIQKKLKYALAIHHIHNREIEDAFNIVKNITFETDQNLLAELAQNFYHKNNTQKALLSIKLINIDLIAKNCINHNRIQYYNRIINKSFTNIFFTELSESCFQLCKNLFKKSDFAKALDVISDKTKEEFYNFLFLENKNRFHNNNFFNNNYFNEWSSNFGNGFDTNNFRNFDDTFNSNCFNSNFFGQRNHQYTNTQKFPQNTIDNYFKTLNISNNANQNEVKKNFYKLSRKYHPDRISKLPNESETEYQKRKKDYEEKFKEISNAYTELNKYFENKK